MSFALWWALTTIPGGIWPSFGTSGTSGTTHWWLQTSILPKERHQLSVRHKQWSLRYGAQPQGWAWQLQSRNYGIWWSSDRRIGVSGEFQGVFIGSPWTGTAAVSRQGWTAQGIWNGIHAVRTYNGQYSMGYQLHKGRFNLQWGPNFHGLGIRLGALEWRRSIYRHDKTDLIRVYLGRSSAEWRRTPHSFGTQEQVGFRTSWGHSRFWIQIVRHSYGTQTLARMSLSQPLWGTATLGYNSGQALVRYNLPDHMKLRGSFVEWSSAVQLHLVHHGRGITATWNPQTGKTNVQIAMRHQFASRQKTKLLAKVEQPTSWLDINYTFAGAPPSVELQLRGVQTHRVVLIAQNRQWKDHVPPGRYAVVGNSPNGWKLELPNDSITLHPGQTSSIWVSLKPKVSNIRWATGPSESPESGNP